jgi:type I restriction enzyme M protein
VAQERKQVNLYPQQVSSVLAQIVTAGKDQLKSVYDPTCGSGSLLLRVAKEVKNVSAFTVRR